jgi:predicted phosphodiesterase
MAATRSTGFPRHKRFQSNRRCRLAMRSLLLTAVLAACGWLTPVASGQEAPPIEEAPQIYLTPQTGSFVVYGDIRFTDPQRCGSSNPRARQELTRRVAQLGEKPDFVVMTGDVVLRGSSEDDWKVFEEETKALRDRAINIFAVLGSHDKDGGGQAAFFHHFAALKAFRVLEKHGWYSLRYGDAYFLMLDSQEKYAEGDPQGIWLRDQLEHVPEGTDFLIVVLHQPIVTHPSGETLPSPCPGGKPTRGGHKVTPAEEQFKQQLEAWAKAHPRPRILVLSGHNHNYERYVENGMTYVVTAGGGAPPYDIQRDPKDFYPEPGPTYHYCRIRVQEKTLTFEMFKLTLRGKSASWERKDSFALK